MHPRTVTRGRGLCLGGGISLTENPRIETPLDRDPPGQRPPWTETTPGQRHPPGQRPSWTEISPDIDPRTETTLDRDPLDIDPQTESALDRDSLDRDPPDRDTPWSCDLWCMLGQRPPTMNRMTDRQV